MNIDEISINDMIKYVEKNTGIEREVLMDMDFREFGKILDSTVVLNTQPIAD
jgi:hypothetical protein